VADTRNRQDRATAANRSRKDFPQRIEAALADYTPDSVILHVARKHGVSVTAMYDALAKRGIQYGRFRRKQYSATIKAHAVELVQGGAALSAVGGLMGIPSATIAGWCKSAGVQSSHRWRRGTQEVERPPWPFRTDEEKALYLQQAESVRRTE